MNSELFDILLVTVFIVSIVIGTISANNLIDMSASSLPGNPQWAIPGSGEVFGDNSDVRSGDKSGTSTPLANKRTPQLIKFKCVAEHATSQAERGRFELPLGFPRPVFETGAFNHSATSPAVDDDSLSDAGN